jgi:hypothetical protein
MVSNETARAQRLVIPHMVSHGLGSRGEGGGGGEQLVIFGSEFGPRTPSKSIGLALLFILDVKVQISSLFSTSRSVSRTSGRQHTKGATGPVIPTGFCLDHQFGRLRSNQ